MWPALTLALAVAAASPPVGDDEIVSVGEGEFIHGVGWGFAAPPGIDWETLAAKRGFSRKTPVARLGIDPRAIPGDAYGRADVPFDAPLPAQVARWRCWTASASGVAALRIERVVGVMTLHFDASGREDRPRRFGGALMTEHGPPSTKSSAVRFCAVGPSVPEVRAPGSRPPLQIAIQPDGKHLRVRFQDPVDHRVFDGEIERGFAKIGPDYREDLEICLGARCYLSVEWRSWDKDERLDASFLELAPRVREIGRLNLMDD